MALFGNKPIYKYHILERYRNSIDECSIVGETSTYRILTLKHGYSSTYFLRQDKKNPKKVVYLGPAHNKICVYRDTIISINRMSTTNSASHPFFFTDIATGERKSIKFLSDKTCRITVSDATTIRSHIYCQDMVESIKIEDEAAVAEVTRYEEDTYLEEFTYHIRIGHNGTNFTREYIYPQKSGK